MVRTIFCADVVRDRLAAVVVVVAFLESGGVVAAAWGLTVRFVVQLLQNAIKVYGSDAGLWRRHGEVGRKVLVRGYSQDVVGHLIHRAVRDLVR